MDDFMKELYKLLKENDATILRSASKEGELVVSIPGDDNLSDFKEFAFSEEISESTIRLDYKFST